MAIARWDPFEVFDRMFNFDYPYTPSDLPTASWGLYEGDWSPRLDLFEDDDAYYVKIDVPGIESRDIDLNVTSDVLTIKGERKPEAEDEERRKGRTYQQDERMYGSFHRTIPLRTPVDPDHVNAKLKDGVLYITLPKREEAKPRKITVGVS